MKKAYYKLIFLIYTVALLVCGGVRMVLQLRYLDVSTGFTDAAAGGLSALFTGVLTAALAALFVLSLLKRVDHDYPVERRSPAVSFLMLPLGASLICYALFGVSIQAMSMAGYNPEWDQTVGILNRVLGGLAGIALFQAGVSGMRRSPRPPISLLILAPALWQLTLLVCRFNSFGSPAMIQDQLLTILYMCFAAVFFVGHARSLCGYAKKNGRNYAVPAGLAVSLCGFLLVLPNFAYTLVYRSPLPSLSLNMWESAYVLFISIYGLGFVVSFCRSIRFV